MRVSEQTLAQALWEIRARCCVWAYGNFNLWYCCLANRHTEITVSNNGYATGVAAWVQNKKHPDVRYPQPPGTLRSLADVMMFLLNNRRTESLPVSQFRFNLHFSMQRAPKIKEVYLNLWSGSPGEHKAIWLHHRDHPLAVDFVAGRAGVEVIDYFGDHYPVVREWLDLSMKGG